MEPQPILLSITGSIGSGKTTTLNQLKKRFPNWHFIDEPVEEWTHFVDNDGKTMLQVFYEDMKRWAYTFQHMALKTRCDSIKRAITNWKKRCEIDPKERFNNIFVTERCTNSDFHIFAKMLRDDNLMTKLEWDLYKTYHYALTEGIKVNGIIYITCSPEKCSERIHVRNRNGEETISVEYLKNLHKYHEDLINNTNLPVIRLDTEKNLIDEYGNFNGKIGNLSYDVAIERFADNLG